MNKVIGLTAVAGVLGLAVVTGMVAKQGQAAAMKSKHAGKRVPVLVELFTSEGCSSCPPADETLARLLKEQSNPDVQIVALSEHVDYWNDIGWNDPFSSSAFSKRQGDYMTALHTDSVYTPQLVVDGQHELIGSHQDKAEAAIAAAAKTRKADVTLEPASGTEKPDTLMVQVKDLPAVKAGDTAEVLLAITENNLTSNVKRGENSGRHLSHVAVVRELRKIGTATTGATFGAKPTLTLKSNWKRKDLSAVVFVQERKSRRVLGVAALSLAK